MKVDRFFRTVDNILFCSLHPIRAIRAAFDRSVVGLFESGVPHGIEIDTYANELSLRQIDREIHLGRGTHMQDWSKSDRKRIRSGEFPKGTPRHREL